MDCENPACNDVKDLLKMGNKKLEAQKNKKTAGLNGNLKSGDAAPPTSVKDDLVDPAEDNGCPMDKGELGAATWGLVHTTAANYPDKPSKEVQLQARAFFSSLATLYPCTYCRKDFRKEIAKEPPDVGSRTALSLWACRQHNLVNKKIGKPIFECTLPLLDERWKTGRRSCWEVDGSEENA